MDERLIAAIAVLPAAIIVGVFGVQMRAGRWLSRLNGIDLAKVRDRDGLGQFAGTMLLALAVVLVLMAAAITVLPEDQMAIVIAICVAANIGIALRLAVGVRGFQRG